MSIVFNADEVLGMAERIEENGTAFYRAAAGKADGEDARILYDLAEWETRHRELFHSMRQELGDSARGTTAYDPDNEATMYLEAMADSAVFLPGADALAELGPEPTMAAILNAAIGREKDAIAFFSAFRELVPEGFGRERVGDILKEEFRHVAILTRQLSTLAG